MWLVLSHLMFSKLVSFCVPASFLISHGLVSSLLTPYASSSPTTPRLTSCLYLISHLILSIVFHLVLAEVGIIAIVTPESSHLILSLNTCMSAYAFTPRPHRPRLASPSCESVILVSYHILPVS